MKNIEFYYDDLLRAPSIYSFCAKHGMNMSECDNDFYDVIKWLNEEHQILDETEKRYLGNIVRPFAHQVIYIKKACVSNNESVIVAYTEHGNIRTFTLPDFKVGTMYVGMEEDEKYSLERLGL